MNPYVGIAIGGLIFIFACIGLGLCIRCMSKFHSSGERDVTGENESVLSETEAQSRGTFFVTFVSRFMIDPHFPLGRGETGFVNPFSLEIWKFLHCEKEGNVNWESTIFDA